MDISLQYLKMITKNGRVVNKAFKTKIFLLLVNLIDPERIKDNSLDDQIFDFMKCLFNNNPDFFNSSQTMIILTRMCLIGFIAFHNRTELAFEVIQIIQFLMKYNK